MLAKKSLAFAKYPSICKLEARHGVELSKRSKSNILFFTFGSLSKARKTLLMVMIGTHYYLEHIIRSGLVQIYLQLCGSKFLFCL